MGEQQHAMGDQNAIPQNASNHASEGRGYRRLPAGAAAACCGGAGATSQAVKTCVLAWCATMKSRQPLVDIHEELTDGAARFARLGDGSSPHIAAALWLAFKLVCNRDSE